MNTMNLHRWIHHFSENQTHRVEPDWDAPITLPNEKIEALLPSLEQFELGDGGGPAYLIAWNREQFLNEPGARQLVDLWFKEEKVHSRLLGDAVKRFGGSSIKSHWSFSVFCFVRKALGVRFELSTLLLTEIVSNVYYKELLKHIEANDPALAQVCRLIIRDETGHIEFHKDRLKRNNVRPSFSFRCIFRAMGLAAATMLWVNHGKAIRTLGGSSQAFYGTVINDLNGFMHGLTTKRSVETSSQHYHCR